jgi:hypothetical protein
MCLFLQVQSCAVLKDVRDAVLTDQSTILKADVVCVADGVAFSPYLRLTNTGLVLDAPTL